MNFPLSPSLSNKTRIDRLQTYRQRQPHTYWMILFCFIYLYILYLLLIFT